MVRAGDHDAPAIDALCDAVEGVTAGRYLGSDPINMTGLYIDALVCGAWLSAVFALAVAPLKRGGWRR